MYLERAGACTCTVLARAGCDAISRLDIGALFHRVHFLQPLLLDTTDDVWIVCELDAAAPTQRFEVSSVRQGAAGEELSTVHCAGDVSVALAPPFAPQ